MGNPECRRFVQPGMRPRFLVPVALAALMWSMVSFVRPPGALACSCAGPPPLVSFDGTAETETPAGVTSETESVDSGVFERDYVFNVDKVISGDVRPTETVRVFTSGGSSCGISKRLLPKGRYRVSASVSALEGKRLLFVTACGGSAELLAAPPGFTTSSTSGWWCRPLKRYQPPPTGTTDRPDGRSWSGC